MYVVYVKPLRRRWEGYGRRLGDMLFSGHKDDKGATPPWTNYHVTGEERGLGDATSQQSCCCNLHGFLLCR
jgi:hypothetical protein